MAKNCPNINHPDWKEYVGKMGSVLAYQLFINNGNRLADTERLPAFGSPEDAAEYLKAYPNLSKDKVDYINGIYKYPIYNINTDETGKVRVEVNVKGVNNFLNSYTDDTVTFGEDFNDVDADYEQKPDEWYDDRAELKDYRTKIAILTKILPDYNIIEDNEFSIPGFINSDNKTITVNPKQLTVDAIGREFGHILLYSLGGLSNPVIARGIELIENKDIIDNIAANNEDVSENKISIEALARTIVRDPINLFSNPKEREEWTRWLEALYNYSNAKLSINNEQFNKLNNYKLNYNWANANKTEEQTLNLEIESTLGKEQLNPYQKLIQESMNVLARKKAILKKSGKDAKKVEINKMIKRIKTLSYADNIPSAMNAFVKFVSDETNKIYNSYLETKAAQSRGEKGFTVKKLSGWHQYVSGLNVIKDYIALVENAAIDRTNPELSNEILQKVSLNTLRDISGKQNQIQKAYLDEGTKLISKFLTKYSSHIAAEYKQAFERDYNVLSEAEKEKITKEEYIDNKMVLNQSRIDMYTEKNIEAELQKASKDINTMQRWVENLLDSSDVVVSSMVRAIADTTTESRNARIAIKDEMVESLRKLEKFAANKKRLFKSQKELYNFMLEEDSLGKLTGNIVDMFHSDFWIDYAKERNKLENNPKLSYNQAQKELTKWKNKNAPMTKESKARYENDKKALVKSMQDNNELTAREVSAVLSYFDNSYKYELANLVNEEAAEKITKWIMNNTWSYRFPVDKYTSKKWNELVRISGADPDKLNLYEQRNAIRTNVSNDARIDFYNTVNTLNSEIQATLPSNHKIYNKLPGVTKKGNELLREGDLKGGLIAKFKESFTTFLDDGKDRGDIQKQILDEGGEPMRFIPVYYTKKLSAEDQSFDIADIYLKYFQSATDYIYKSKILPEIEMTKYLVNNREVISRTSAGKKIVDAILNKQSTTKGSSLIGQQFNDWLDAVVYDIKERDQGKIGNTKIDKAKFINAIGRYTAMNMLGLNFVTGVSNVTVGSAMQWIEAAGGEFYNIKDYVKAKTLYNRNLIGILGDIGSRTENNIVNVLNRHFDTLNEYSGGNIRRDSRFAQLITSDALFFTSHAGEHAMQSKVMLAMLNSLKAKDRDGNVLGPMIKYLSVENGKISIDKQVANFGKTEQLAFERKLKRVLSSLHGEYSELGRIALQKGAIGRLVYMFRKFIITGIKRRYGATQVNNMTGDITEGNYRTFGKFFAKLMKDIKGLELALMSEDWKRLTDMEKSNIRKTLTELSLFLAVTILISVRFAGDDDDNGNKNDSWIYDFLAYQAFRFRSELTFFANPIEAIRITNSPMAATNTFKNMFKLLGQMIYPITSGTLEFDRYERGNWKDELKMKKTLTNMIPAYKQIYRLKYVDDQLTWLKN